MVSLESKSKSIQSFPNLQLGCIHVGDGITTTKTACLPIQMFPHFFVARSQATRYKQSSNSNSNYVPFVIRGRGRGWLCCNHQFAFQYHFTCFWIVMAAKKSFFFSSPSATSWITWRCCWSCCVIFHYFCSTCCDCQKKPRRKRFTIAHNLTGGRFEGIFFIIIIIFSSFLFLLNHRFELSQLQNESRSKRCFSFNTNASFQFHFSTSVIVIIIIIILRQRQRLRLNTCERGYKLPASIYSPSCCCFIGNTKQQMKCRIQLKVVANRVLNSNRLSA